MPQTLYHSQLICLRRKVLNLYSTLAHRRPIFTAEMTTYYYRTIEEALKKAKAAGKRPGCWYGGIVLKSGRRGFAVYREGKVVA